MIIYINVCACVGVYIICVPQCISTCVTSSLPKCTPTLLPTTSYPNFCTRTSYDTGVCYLDTYITSKRISRLYVFHQFIFHAYHTCSTTHAHISRKYVFYICLRVHVSYLTAFYIFYVLYVYFISNVLHICAFFFVFHIFYVFSWCTSLHVTYVFYILYVFYVVRRTIFCVSTICKPRVTHLLRCLAVCRFPRSLFLFDSGPIPFRSLFGNSWRFGRAIWWIESNTAWRRPATTSVKHTLNSPRLRSIRAKLER